MIYVLAKSRYICHLFPLIDHLVQELNDRPLSQENRFIGRYLVPAKLNAFNSGVQDKLYETYKPIFQRRETLTMKF